MVKAICNRLKAVGVRAVVILAQVSGMGVDADIAAMGLCALWGAYDFLTA